MISTTPQSFVVILYTNFELEILSCMFTIKTGTWIVAALLGVHVLGNHDVLVAESPDPFLTAVDVLKLRASGICLCE